MSFKGLNKTINNLLLIKKELIAEIGRNFIEASLQWIAEEANRNLDNRLNEPPHFWGSDARVWITQITGNVGKLENMDDNSAGIEFGIGLEGTAWSPIVWVARQEGWEYNVPSSSKNEDGSWTFKDEKTGIWVRDFLGYKGKSFLYDAFTSYMQSKVWLNIYQMAFDKAMRRFK